jgi:uncharacterized protein
MFVNMKLFLFLLCSVVTEAGFCQNNKLYEVALKNYQRKYVATHEVVKGGNRKHFRFYPIAAKFNITCRFEKSTDTATVVMKTSGTKIPTKDFVRYGKIFFTSNDTALSLTVYRSKELQNNPQYSRYLFIPFTDATTGNETYSSGRYIDFFTWDIKNDTVTIDFNKAYNPYCAYSAGYNCPIPPRENELKVAINAGEKLFGKRN